MGIGKRKERSRKGRGREGGRVGEFEFLFVMRRCGLDGVSVRKGGGWRMRFGGLQGWKLWI